MCVASRCVSAVQVLTSLHPNIMVVRHRSRFGHNISWSHHEKIVCVDQASAFIGGLDLALMRWDTAAHELTDIGPAKLWPGKDYCNPRYDRPLSPPPRDRACEPASGLVGAIVLTA